MADYQYQRGASGVIYKPTGAFIPEAPGNRDWEAYQTWLGLGNTPDAAPEPDLAPYRAAAKALLAREAEGHYWRRFEEHFGPRDAYGPMSTWVVEIERREAVAADADGSPSASDYPFLDARADAYSTSIAAEADAVIASYDAWKVDAAGIRQTLLEAFASVDGAGTATAVDNVVATTYWPGFIEPDPVVVTVSVLGGAVDPVQVDPVVVAVTLPAPTVVIA